MKTKTDSIESVKATLYTVKNGLLSVSNTLLEQLQQDNTKLGNIAPNSLDMLNSDLHALSVDLSNLHNPSLTEVATNLQTLISKIDATIINNTSFANNTVNDIVSGVRQQIITILGV